jgi:apolipoprotein N-acyltransferase
VIDSFGHVVSSLPLGAEGVLVTALPGALPATLYARLGLTLPALLAVLFLILGFWLGRQTVNK